MFGHTGFKLAEGCVRMAVPSLRSTKSMSGRTRERRECGVDGVYDMECHAALRMYWTNVARDDG